MISYWKEITKLTTMMRVEVKNMKRLTADVSSCILDKPDKTNKSKEFPLTLRLLMAPYETLSRRPEKKDIKWPWPNETGNNKMEKNKIKKKSAKEGTGYMHKKHKDNLKVNKSCLFRCKKYISTNSGTDKSLEEKKKSFEGIDVCELVPRGAKPKIVEESQEKSLNLCENATKSEIYKQVCEPVLRVSVPEIVEELQPEPFEVKAESLIISANILNKCDGEVGPGASKTGIYKNPEYFCYHPLSFYNAQLEMSAYRLQQPSNKATLLKDNDK